MSARRELIRRLSEDSLGGIATLQDVTDAEQLLNAYRAEVLREGLTDTERQFLSFALDLAAAQMASRGDEFNTDDEAAMDSLRRMAGGPREGESTPADVTVYRAAYEHEPFPLGLYANREAAQAHCEHDVSIDYPAGTALFFDWITDDEDDVTELVVRIDNDEQATGYMVTTVVAEGTYDPEADG